MNDRPSRSKRSNGSANDQDNNGYSTTDQILEQKPIEGTPFHTVRMDNKYFLAIGKYRLTEPTESEEDVIKESEVVTWNRLIAVMAIIAQEEAKEKAEQAAVAMEHSMIGKIAQMFVEHEEEMHPDHSTLELNTPEN